MPIPKDYKEIVEILSDATNEGRVKWASTRFGVEVSVSGSRFVIWAGTDEESGRSFVSFGLADEKGKTIDTWYLDEGEAEYSDMQRFFASAKRQALGIPQRLASIRDAIGNAEIIGDTDTDNKDEITP